MRATKYIQIPFFGSYLIFGWRITQKPSFSTAFLTARFTRLRASSTALPSLALCQYLLMSVSLRTTLAFVNSNSMRKIALVILLTRSTLLISVRSLEPS